MELTAELKMKIEETFANNVELRKKLLNFDVDSIRQIGTKGKTNFSPEDVIDCYETESMSYLYKIALKRKKYSQLYFEIIGNGPDPYFIEDGSTTKYDNTPMTREELLDCDPDTIREIGIYGQNGISAQTVIDKFNNNENDKLYEIAKKKILCAEVYFEYIGEKTSGNGKK